MHIFISYSRNDEAIKDRLLKHLRVLQLENVVQDVWDDSRIAAGADWRTDITAAMTTADLGVLLISVDFLTSQFIREQEVPALLKRRVFPIIARACPWQEVQWLRQLQVRPKNGKPLPGGKKMDEALTIIARELAGLAKTSSATAAMIGAQTGHAGASEGVLIYSDSALPRKWVDISRDTDDLAVLLKRTDAEAPGLIDIVGIGGSGKSCFSRHFFEKLKDCGLSFHKRIWFSFYKLRGQVDPFGHFLDFVLPRLDTGNSSQNPSPPRTAAQKRARLEEVFREQRILVVLDGLEIAQHGSGQKYGSLINPEFTAFLRGALNFSSSRVLVTTRIPLLDLADSRGYQRFTLRNWSADEVVEYFRSDDIQATNRDVSRLIDALGAHPLTLSIFRHLLKQLYNGDVRQAFEVVRYIKSPAPPATPQVEKLRAVLNDMWQHLGLHDRFFMKRMSALYGEAGEATYQVLTSLDPGRPRFRLMLHHLLDAGLIISGNHEGRQTLNAHPLVKQFCYAKMAKNERQRIHHALAAFLEGRAKPEVAQTPSDLDDFVEWFQQCIRGEMFKKAYNILERHEFRAKLYYIGWYQGQLELIESLTAKVLETSGENALGPTERIALSMTQGHITRKLGRAEEAIRHFEAARRIAISSGLAVQAYGANVEKAITLGFQGNFSEARELLPSSPLDQPNYYDTPRLEWLGLSQAMLGNADVGRALLEDAVALARTKKDNRHLPAILTHLGDVLLHMRRFDEAEPVFEEALQFSRAKKYRDYEGDALRGLGDLWLSRRRPDRAREFYDGACKIAEDLGYRFMHTQTLIGLARLTQFTHSDSNESDRYAKRALSIALESGYKYQQAETHLILADSETGLKIADRREHYATARSLAELLQCPRLLEELRRTRIANEGTS